MPPPPRPRAEYYLNRTVNFHQHRPDSAVFAPRGAYLRPARRRPEAKGAARRRDGRSKDSNQPVRFFARAYGPFAWLKPRPHRLYTRTRHVLLIIIIILFYFFTFFTFSRVRNARHGTVRFIYNNTIFCSYTRGLR